MTPRKFVIAALLLWLPCAVAQAKDLDALKNCVVRITTPESEGAGIAIGTDGDSIFIITARHVVPDGNVSVQFNAARHKNYTGRVSRVSSDIDLALVVVPMPANDAVRRSLKPLTSRAAPVPLLTVVSNISHSADPWELNFGVNKVQAEELSTIKFSKVGVVQGSSGGPLFDDADRLIGMVTEVDASRATAVKLQAILDVLTTWSVTANLLGARARGKAGIFFSSDLSSCSLNASIVIGDRRVHVTRGGTWYSDLPLGKVDYRVTGTVVCAAAGKSYQVSGHGAFVLESGDKLLFMWLRGRSGSGSVYLFKSQ